LKSLLGSIGLVSSDHLDESKATGLLGMRIKHNLALLDITIFFKEASHFGFRQTWVNSSHEEVGAWVDGTIILRRTTVVLGWATSEC